MGGRLRGAWVRWVGRWRAWAVRRGPGGAALSAYEAALADQFAGRFAAAVVGYEQVRRALAGVPVVAWRHALAVHYLEALLGAGLVGEAFGLAVEEVAAWPESPDVAYLAGEAALAVATEEPARAAELLPVVDQAWRRALHLGERPDLVGSTPGRGSWLAASRLGDLHDALGDADHAAACRELAATLRESL